MGNFRFYQHCDTFIETSVLLRSEPNTYFRLIPSAFEINKLIFEKIMSCLVGHRILLSLVILKFPICACSAILLVSCRFSRFQSSLIKSSNLFTSIPFWYLATVEVKYTDTDLSLIAGTAKRNATPIELRRMARPNESIEINRFNLTQYRRIGCGSL